VLLPDRACLVCDGPIPTTSPRAVHCSKKCRSETDVRDAGPTGLRQPPALPVVLEEDWSESEQLEFAA